ncbi:MAG: response regulator transcription factor [Thermodesulfovibrionales bacterium]|nr:response regulator transcription factor [Thermodesulfovibrionales bacterium]
MKKQLLVVDDDPDILKVLKANFELYGFDAVTAANWAEAHDILNNQLPDIIILDLMLPDSDGIQICRLLKDQYPRIPIIMLTAKDSVFDKVMGFESGADDYIVKPFETLELIARIRACLKRTMPVDSTIVINNLEVNFSAHTVKVKGKEIELTPKEYELLHLFITNRGEVISRQFIRKKIWRESEIYSWSRVIDVHIQHLRHKIEKNPSEPEYILTVSGAGYKFRQ